MILYLDTSALVKRYVIEARSEEVVKLIDEAELAGSIVLTKVEMAAAFSKAVRQNWITRPDVDSVWQVFINHWPSFTKLTVTPRVLDRATQLAWEPGLRGYDALHLAAALNWQETIGTPLTFATFDHDLWMAAQKAGIVVWPSNE